MKNSPLYQALKQLSSDLHRLIELSSQETDESWSKMMETLEKELHDEAQAEGAQEKDEKAVSRAIVQEIYHHLSTLISRMKDSQDRFRKLATRDILTGLYNRHYFNESIVRDIQRAERYHETLSVIVIDIDNFKHINDTFGHVHGDGVIIECARMLKQSVRKSDFLCRYGGDEFIIVTPQPTVEDNEPLFERIREHLRQWNEQFSTFDYVLSLSMGCAVWTEGRDILDVIHEADVRMYEDKQRKKG